MERVDLIKALNDIRKCIEHDKKEEAVKGIDSILINLKAHNDKASNIIDDLLNEVK